MFEEFKKVKKFSRKDENSKQLLAVLRRLGKVRTRNYVDNCKKSSSQAFKILEPYIRWKYSNKKYYNAGLFIDCGCGDAPEVFLANDYGMNSIGLDVFPLTEIETANHKPLAKGLYKRKDNCHFLQADVCEIWGLNKYTDTKADIIHSNAMIALMDKYDRIKFYNKAYNLLKYGGLFCVNYQYLINGYIDYWDITEKKIIKSEKETLKKIGFKVIFENSMNLLLTNQK